MTHTIEWRDGEKIEYENVRFEYQERFISVIHFVAGSSGDIERFETIPVSVVRRVWQDTPKTFGVTDSNGITT